MSKHKWEVVVGNIGTVYDGSNGFEATKEYNQYVRLSKDNYGRVAGESVILFRDDDVYKEYYGTIED